MVRRDADRFFYSRNAQQSLELAPANLGNLILVIALFIILLSIVYLMSKILK